MTRPWRPKLTVFRDNGSKDVFAEGLNKNGPLNQKMTNVDLLVKHGKTNILPSWEFGTNIDDVGEDKMSSNISERHWRWNLDNFDEIFVGGGFLMYCSFRVTRILEGVGQTTKKHFRVVCLSNSLFLQSDGIF